MDLIPRTKNEAEKKGFAWVNIIESYCNSCITEAPVSIYKKDGSMEYFCENCGMNQNQ